MIIYYYILSDILSGAPRPGPVFGCGRRQHSLYPSGFSISNLSNDATYSTVAANCKITVEL
jgi:hypothetical protein